MGFLRADIEVAMQAMQSNETDVVMEYLLNNPRGEEFQSSLPEGESVTATGGAVDAAGDVPLQDITAIGAEGEEVIAGDDLSAAPATGTGTGTVPVTASLAASIGDISVIESDDSMAVQDPATFSSEMPVVLNAVDSVESIAGATTGTATTTATATRATATAAAVGTAAALGIVAIEGASAAPEQTQTTTTTTASNTAAAANGPADVLLLRRDLGQLITELSRLCEEDGTPRLLDPTSTVAPVADPVPTLDSASFPLSTTSTAETAEAILVPQGIEAPSIAVPGTPIPVIPSVSTDEGPRITRARETVSEAQLMLQTLGRQGLGLPDADPGSANWVSPASRAIDSLVRPIKYSETQNHTHFYHLFMQFAVRVCTSLHECM